VQVRHDEGVAIRIDPKPCAGLREDAGEASAGACTGQPLSRDNWISLGADAFDNAEGDTGGSVIASLVRPGVVEDPGMCRSSLYGNREISGSACGGHRRSAMGRRGVEAVDARAREV
jgi:hypothetical protein